MHLLQVPLLFRISPNSVQSPRRTDAIIGFVYMLKLPWQILHMLYICFSWASLCLLSAQSDILCVNLGGLKPAVCITGLYWHYVVIDPSVIPSILVSE